MATGASLAENKAWMVPRFRRRAPGHLHWIRGMAVLALRLRRFIAEESIAAIAVDLTAKAAAAVVAAAAAKAGAEGEAGAEIAETGPETTTPTSTAATAAAAPAEVISASATLAPMAATTTNR